MRLVALALAAGVLSGLLPNTLLPCPWDGASSHADEDEEITRAELSRRRSDLRKRANKWWLARKKLVTKCQQCGGTGRITQVFAGRGGGQRTTKCSRCAGYGRSLSRKNFETTNYTLMSPAYRLRPGSRQKVKAEYSRLCTSSTVAAD